MVGVATTAPLPDSRVTVTTVRVSFLGVESIRKRRGRKKMGVWFE